MAMRLGKLYDALVQAGATTELASQAVDELASFRFRVPPLSRGTNKFDELSKELFIRQTNYLTDAKKLYLEEAEKTERAFLIATGALMAFLCTDAVSSFNVTYYPYLWFIPALVCIYASLTLDNIRNALVDIADFEIKFIEPLFEEGLPKWESHLLSSRTAGGRAKTRTSLKNRFWIALAIINAAIGAIQIYTGPIFWNQLKIPS